MTPQDSQQRQAKLLLAYKHVLEAAQNLPSATIAADIIVSYARVHNEAVRQLRSITKDAQ